MTDEELLKDFGRFIVSRMIMQKEELLLKKIWLKNNGDKIYIGDMDDSHLTNCAYKVARENWRVEWLPILVNELKERGKEEVANSVESLYKMNEALR